jgi:hypothetical protein
VTLGLVPVAALGGLDWDPQQLAGAEFHDPAAGTSAGRLLVAGQLAETRPAATALTVGAAIPDPGERITLVATGRQTDNLATWYVWMLQREYGRAWPVYPSTFTARTAADFRRLVLGDRGHHFLVVSDDPATLGALAALARQRPDLRLQVDDIRLMRSW